MLRLFVRSQSRDTRVISAKIQRYTTLKVSNVEQSSLEELMKEIRWYEEYEREYREKQQKLDE